MDGQTLWRAAVVQAALVAALSVVLALVTGDDFFEDWGWLAGPAAWFACAMATAAVLRLPSREALFAAIAGGAVSGTFVLIGVHWLGAALAVGVFAAWLAVRAPARLRS